MNTQYTEFVAAVLKGSPIKVQAEAAGIHMETLRRLVMKHPGYAKAKAAGKLHSKGLPGVVPLDKSTFATHPAVLDVCAGATMTEASTKHGVPYSTLQRMLAYVFPDKDFRRDHATTLEAARVAVKHAEEALQKARSDLARLESLAPTSP